MGGLPLRKPAGRKQSLRFQSSANSTTFCICISNSSSLLNQTKHAKAYDPSTRRANMILPRRLSWLAWPLFALPTVVQFNDTFKFTVDSLDGLVDVDGASEWWGGPPFTMDNATGYRTSAGSGGSSGCAFVGVGFDVQGLARWRNANHQVNRSDPQSIDPVLGFLQRPTVGTAGPSTQLNGTVRETPDLMSASGLNLSAYELRWSYSPDAIFEFHNLSINVTFRTQA